MMSKILLTETNLFLLEDLAKTLLNKGHLVDKASKLDRCKELILGNKYDLLIFDRYLSGINSLDLVEELRNKDFFEKILILSQQNCLEDRILSLNLADDFLAKPFSHLEFSLRVENLLKRGKIRLEPIFNYQSITLYDSGKLVMGDIKDESQQAVCLRPKEKKILECLIRHLNHAVSYQSLINYVWGLSEELPQLRTLNVYIRRIRMKLGVCGSKLKTIRAYGFILEA